MYKPITKRIFDHPRFKRGSMLFDKHDNGDPKAQIFGEGSETITEVDPTVTQGDDEIVKRKASKNRCGTQAEKDAGIVEQTCEESGYNDVLEKRKTDPCYNFDCSSVPGSKPKVVGDKCECVKEGKKVEKCKEGFTKNAETGKCEKIEKTPGFTGDLYKTMQGTVKQPWQVRQQNRAAKKAGKDVRRAEVKLSKFGIRQPDGTYKMKEGLSARQQAKFRENLNELGTFQLQAKNIRQDVGTGKIAGETYYKGQRKMDQAEVGGAGPDNQGDEQAQKEMIAARQEYEQSLTNKIAQSNNNQADSAIEVEPVKNTFDDVAAEQSRINSTPDFQNSVNTDFGQYKFGNYTPKFGTGVTSFFKKAKPLSKNYFIERSKNK